MSQKATRKSAVSEEKEKRQTDSPVKEMKKKMAANAEKEKQAAEKTTEKPADKTEKPKPAEKSTEKKEDKKQDKVEKNGAVAEKDKDNKEKDKKTENKEKKDAEKKDDKEDSKADNKTEKTVKPKEKTSKQNGSKHNGVETNGEPLTISDEDDALVIDDEDPRDEMFPELAYEESDGDFEPSTDGAPSRSFTRRSQVKAARTPETPRPASDKQPDQAAASADDSKDSKLLKMSEPPPSDRKLRSADSPKPESKKDTKKTETESPKKDGEKEKANKEEKGQDDAKDKEETSEGAKEKEMDKLEMDVTVEIEHEEGERRKAGTNFAKSRVKVSPYRRSARLADHTAASTQANYTGNNSTMEMDITESSSMWETSLEDSYLSGLRAIRGRRSYKQLAELEFKHLAATRSNTSLASDSSLRPTGTVVGRKRKPERDPELALEAVETHSKRVRLLERIAQPFRRTTTTSTPLPARRAAEIVGINTDLPLTAPVAAPDTFDPESLKAATTSVPLAPAAAPPPERDAKRCVVM